MPVYATPFFTSFSHFWHLLEPTINFNRFELAFNGIFNFSDFPVKIITRLGFFTVAFSLLYFVYNIYRKFAYNDVPQGFTATILAIILFSGVQMISLGLIGEYVLRIYNQVRNRPLFVIDKVIQEGEKK